jgi:WD40 repeat protein
MATTPGPPAPLTPSRTVITSFTPRRPSQSQLSSENGVTTPYEEGDWVLCLASPQQQQQQPQHHFDAPPTIACALSNNQIIVYDQQRLHPVHTFQQVHEPAHLTSELLYGPQNTLLSAGSDGSLRVFDLRQASLATRIAIQPGQAALCVSLGYDGYLAAVGSDKARIHFVDLRKSQSLVGSYVDAHTDAITTLSFSGPSMLVSGSEDGLTCVFDTTQPTEDAALKTIINVNAPLRKVGFCQPGNSNNSYRSIYCLTGSETASIWDVESACCIHEFGTTLRQSLAQQAPSVSSIDYLINVHVDATSQELFLTAGNSQGTAALYRLGSNTSPTTRQWELCHVMEGGHRGVIRDVCYLSPSIMMTAGEDARLCEWNRFRGQTYSDKAPKTPFVSNGFSRHLEPAPAMSTATSGGGGPLRRPRSRQRAGPY